jgi:hypothetical protein
VFVYALYMGADQVMVPAMVRVMAGSTLPCMGNHVAYIALRLAALASPVDSHTGVA